MKTQPPQHTFPLSVSDQPNFVIAMLDAMDENNVSVALKLTYLAQCILVFNMHCAGQSCTTSSLAKLLKFGEIQTRTKYGRLSHEGYLEHEPKPNTVSNGGRGSINHYSIHPDIIRRTIELRDDSHTE